TVHEAVLLGLRAQDGEDQLLLAHVGGAVDVEVLGDLRQLADFFLFEGLEVQRPILLGRGFLDGRDGRFLDGGFGRWWLHLGTRPGGLFPVIVASTPLDACRTAGLLTSSDGFVGHMFIPSLDWWSSEC